MSPPSALPAHLLHLITLHTLSNQGFSSSHSTASIALADILGRYISLLASTAGDYAAASGRTSVGVLDGVEALEEIGLGMDELEDFMRDTPGRGRIGGTEALKAYLEEGRDLDTSSHRRCTFTDVPPELLSELLERQDPSHYLLDGTKIESDEEGDSLSNVDGSASDTGSAASTSFSIALTAEDSPAVETPKALGSWKDAYGHERDSGVVRRMGKGVDREEYGGLPTPREEEFDEEEEEGDDDLPFGRITSFLPPLPNMNPMAPPPLPSHRSLIVDLPAPNSPPSRNETPRDSRAPSLLPGSSSHRLDDRPTNSSSSQPSYLLPTPFPPQADPITLPIPSTTLTSLLPPLPNPHNPSTSTLPSLLATNASLQSIQPTSFSRGNQKRFRTALNFSHRAAESYTSSNSLFGAIPVPTPRHSHLVPSQPTDPTVALLSRTLPVAGLTSASGAINPATPHRYPSALALALGYVAPANLVARTMRMGNPGVLQDERGERLFYGGTASIMGVVEGPVEKKPGEEVWDEEEWGPEDESEKGKVVAKEMQVEVRATWDTPVRNWADPDLPFERKRRR